MSKLPYAISLLCLTALVLFGTGTLDAIDHDSGALRPMKRTAISPIEGSLVLASTSDSLSPDVLAPFTERTPIAAVALPEPQEYQAPSAVPIILQREVGRLTKRIEWLETELDLCGSEVTQGPVGRWLAILRPEERPDKKTLRMVSAYLKPYPIELSPAEGLWVAERARADDWKTYAPTIDEALILFLGPARLSAELSEAQLTVLREEWNEEGFFQ